MTRLSKQRAAYDESYRINAQIELNSVYGEIILDVIMVRLLVILPFLTSFLSLLLIGLHFDGYPINLWICATPVLFLFVYVLFCVVLTKYVKARQFSSKSVFYGLWNHLHSPFKLLFKESVATAREREAQGTRWNSCNCRSSNRCRAISPGVTCVLFVFLLVLAQIILVTLKLSSLDLSSTLYGQLTALTWGVVFVPIWCMFALYCMLPGFRVVQAPMFLTGLIVLWAPFFISMVCLTVKLNAVCSSNSSSASSTAAGSSNDIRLAYIFMPFWVIEGIIIVFSSLFLVVGYKR